MLCEARRKKIKIYWTVSNLFYIFEHFLETLLWALVEITTIQSSTSSLRPQPKTIRVAESGKQSDASEKLFLFKTICERCWAIRPIENGRAQWKTRKSKTVTENILGKLLLKEVFIVASDKHRGPLEEDKREESLSTSKSGNLSQQIIRNSIGFSTKSTNIWHRKEKTKKHLRNNNFPVCMQ